MSEVMSNPVMPVERQCQIEEVFDPGFIELLRLAPRNPHVRALILKMTGKMPGAECGTFDQIKAWTETTCEKKARPLPSRSTQGAVQDGISIDVEFSETEYGRASYSVPRSGSEEFQLSAEDLLEMVQEAIADGEGMDKIVDRIADKIDEDAWNQCDPSLDNYGDYDFDHYEADDSGNSEATYSREQIRSRVLAFVQARQPELAGEL
jgi:hypothetical protein